MRCWSFLPLSFLLFSLDHALEISASSISLSLKTRSQSKRPNGVYNPAVAMNDRSRISSKYGTINKQMKRHRNRRQTSTIPVIDYFEAGTDMQYVANLSIGTPSQHLLVLLDTGSSEFFLPGPISNTIHDVFEVTESSTFKGSEEEWSVEYGAGTTHGQLCKDTVTLGNATVYDCDFALANDSIPSFEPYPASGVLGLSPSQGGRKSFVERLHEEKWISQNMFSMFFQRSDDVDGNAAEGMVVDGGVLVLGGIVEEKHYSGEITYNRVEDEDFWEIYMDGILSNGRMVNNTFSKASIDTGTSLIYLPTDVANRFYEPLRGRKVDSAGHYGIPCNTMERRLDVSLQFAGVRYAMQLDDLFIGFSDESQQLCVMSILGTDALDVHGKPLAVIGAAFLKNVVAVFDRSDHMQIGLASAIRVNNGTITARSPRASKARTIASTIPIYSAASPCLPGLITLALIGTTGLLHCM